MKKIGLLTLSLFFVLGSWGTKYGTFAITTEEGVFMTFFITYEDAYYKAVAVGAKGSSSSTEPTSNAIPTTTEGIITIPSEVEYNGLTYKVTKIGKNAFKDCVSITKVIIPEGVSSIDNQAFSGCQSLNAVNFPETISLFGVSSFEGCESLTTIHIPSKTYKISNSAFKGCTQITEVSIPASVSNIEDDAFTGCSLTRLVLEDGTKDLTLGYNASLTSGASYKGLFYLSSTPVLSEIYIGRNIVCTVPKPFKGLTSLKTVRYGNGVKTIEEGEFYQCTNLSTVELGSGLTSIGKEAFYECTSLGAIDLHDSQVSIGEYAFYKCSNLKTAKLGNSLYLIKQYAFYQCLSLESIDIPNSAISIGDYAFYQCSDLSSVTIGDGVSSIGWNAFNGCSHITSLTLGNGIESIGLQAFYGCSSIQEVTIPASTTEMKSNAFSSCTSLKKVSILGELKYLGGFSNCKALSSINIPNSVTQITDNAFSGCTSLTSLTLPNSVTSIGQYAFYGCTNLANIQMPQNLNTIGKYAFQNCGVSSIMISQAIRSIGEYAFKGCQTLTTVTIEKTSPLSINTNVFEDVVANATLHVPYGSKSAYQNNSSWKAFKSIEESGAKVGDTFNTTIPHEGATINCTVTVTGVDPLEVVIGNGSSVAMTGSLSGELTIPSSITGHDGTSFLVTGVNYKAFYGKNISSLVISKGIKTIYKNAFFSCANLTSVSLPNSITDMENAFTTCTSLNSISVDWRDPSELKIDTKNFDDSPSDAVLYVPAGTKKRYGAIDFWQKFSNIIEVSPLSIGDISMRHGTTIDLPVILNSKEEIAGLQFKLTLPEGASLVEEDNQPVATLTERTEGFTVMGLKDPDDDKSYSFVVFSLEGTPIAGNEGTVLNLKLETSSKMELGKYDIEIGEVHMATSTFETKYSSNAVSELEINNITLGDINDDNQITAQDASLILQKVAGKIYLNNDNISAADVNGDGSITAQDASLILQKVAGKTNW